MTHSSSVEVMTIEFYQIKQKWHLCAYKLPTQTDLEFTDQANRTLKYYILFYKNILILGDLSITTEDLYLHNLLQVMSSFKITTCYE